MIKRFVLRCTAVMALALAVQSTVAAVPERIVSTDGALTEIIYALGEQKRLVGVDSTSQFPPAAAALPQVGYKRALSSEGILSLTPDLLLVTNDSGPEKVLGQIEGASVSVERMMVPPTLEGVRLKIESVAKLLEKQAEGQRLWGEVEQAVNETRRKLGVVDKPVKVLFVLGLAGRSPLVGGMNTTADSIIGLAGGDNVAKDIDGYKPMSPEGIAALQPDVILMMRRNGEDVDAESILSKPGFALTPAAQHKRLITMDGMLLLGFGPRLGVAVKQLAQQLYPERMK